MNCLIVSATAAEISPFLQLYRENRVVSKAEMDVLITGVGLTAATYSITRQVQLKRPGLIIQAGIAGSFDRNIPLGTVLCIKEEAIADLGVVEKNKLKTLFDLQLAGPDQYPFKKGWLVNSGAILKKVTLKKVKAVSCNEVSSSVQKIRLYKEFFNPVVESMEGAALHYVALMERIPFIQLRSTSNYIGERNKKNWKLKESIGHLNNELIHLLETL